MYAAAEAARVNRLHQKLKALAMRDADGDIEVEEVDRFDDEGANGAGWFWFAQFGLMDQDDVTSESMSRMQTILPSGISL